MSEVDARPPPTRGRSSHRGGRGGFGRGGARGGSRKLINGSNPVDDAIHASAVVEDQGEVGEMKKKYASELVLLKDMFPDWTDVDLVFALHEADGDVPSTVDHITQGNVSQFAEVKSTKDRARLKVKESSTTASGTDKSTGRGGRGRSGVDGARGGRSRGSDRGRGSLKGARGAHTVANGAAKEAAGISVPTVESTAWEETATVSNSENKWDMAVHDAKQDTGDTAHSAWANVVTSDITSATASEGAKSTLIPEGGPKKSWASMFAPKPAPVPLKKSTTVQPQPVDVVASSEIGPTVEELVGETTAEESHVLAPALLEDSLPPPLEDPSLSEAAPLPPGSADGEELVLTPSKNPLTEENVEHLPDESVPPATHTVASTTGSVDARNLTPLPNQQAPVGRPPMGGYATSAYRATGTPGRSASYIRRVQEQREAVVMPGHNAVDRAAVQFGSMGLNGEPGLDVDEDREEPETRQAPQHSPPSQPRTSLPPAPRQAIPPHEMPEGLPTPKQAPGLPPASQLNQQQMHDAALGHNGLNETNQMNQTYNQYGRYGQSGMLSEAGVQQQKQYDPFNHQTQPSNYDQYGIHAQQQQVAQQQQQQHQQQQQGHGGFGGLSSAPSDPSSYNTADQQRNTYNQYYGGSYGPQDVRGSGSQVQQDVGIRQQRSTSGFGAGPNESVFASQAQQQAQTQARFPEANESGHNTPNPIMGGQQQTPGTAQNQHSMQQAQGQGQQQSAYGAAHANFPYGHPYYNSPYQQAYQNQFGYSHHLQNYGGGFPGKQNMYAGSHGYGMGPQSSFDQHSSSPANAGAFNQSQQTSMRSASGMSGLSGGMEEYGRSSGQNQQQSGGFGGMNDPFARSTSGFGGQSGYGQQNLAGAPEETLKPFNDGKGGPSPSLGQPGRPGSATNNTTSSIQSGLLPAQNHQSPFSGGYPGFAGHGQYGGLGGLGSQQHGHSTMGGQAGYGNYGAGGFGQTYGGYGTRGGWGSNYGH